MIDCSVTTYNYTNTQFFFDNANYKLCPQI